MKLSFLIILFVNSVFACDPQEPGNEMINSIAQFSSSLSYPIKVQSCTNFGDIKDNDALNKQVATMVQNQTNSIWKIKNRHKMGSALNECSPNKNSKALVITFAGTGAFNPRTYSLMADLIKCPEFQDLPDWMKASAYSKILQSLKDKKSSYTKWSGIEKGILSTFIKKPSLNKHAKDFDYAVFASEESEILADPQKISTSSFTELAKEMGKSVSGFPQGIKDALACAITYFKEAKSLNINPKLIVLSHSSGGRSSVKFHEKLKLFLPNKSSDLSITLDPVKEAHHAIQEVASQYAGKAGNHLIDYIPFVEVDKEELNKPVNVWTRKQPNSLYKTSNSERWINFYQNEDSNGLGMSPKFGIHGSPIHNSDKNIFIKDLGKKAHGSICYDDKVLNQIEKEVLILFE